MDNVLLNIIHVFFRYVAWLAPLSISLVHAQTWPAQPVRVIVPFAAGGSADIAGRLVSEELSRQLGHRFVVENRTGAGAVIGTEAAARAPKDGYTVLFTTIAHAQTRALYSKLPFDPINDFVPVALPGLVPHILVVNRDLPVKDTRELIALLKSNPGKYNYGSAGNASGVHFASELFLSMAGGLQVQHVPYRGSAPALLDLMNGSVAMMVDIAVSALPMIRDGRVRGLAISTKKRSSLAPELPTIDESGLPGFEVYGWYMVFLPTGAPDHIVRRLNSAINKSLLVPTVAERFRAMTVETVPDSTPESTGAFLRQEVARWTDVAQRVGIKPN